MGKYKYREGSYGYMESIGFESIRSMIDDEISNNKKTDEQQSEDIAQEGQERQTADEQFDERISALEDAISGSSEIEENFNEFTGTTYPADKEALESKDAELEAAIAEKADAAAVEEVQAAIDTLNGDSEGSVKKTAEDAAVAEVAKVVAEAPEDLDTLKEVADYIAADKTKASEIETKLSEHDAAVEGLGAKDEELAAKDEELAAKDAELEAAIAEKADASALEEEIARAEAAEQAINTKVDAKADNDALEAEIARALGKERELQASIAEKASNDSLTEEKERAEAAEQELESKLDAKADASTVAGELTELKNKDTELEAKDAAQDEEIAKKVEWTESTPGRNHIVLKNHDSILGTATDGSTYNVAMVSKWDVADFGSAQLHANLNSKDGVVTINDDKAVATKDEVEAVDAKVDAIDLTPYAKSEDVNAELANKANASDLSALNDTVGQLSSKVDEKAAQSDLEAEVARAEAKEAELAEKDTELEAGINDEATRATAAESELEGKVTAEQARAEAKEAELVAKDTELEGAINDEATRATAAESELEGKVTAEQARAEAKEAELVAKDEAQDAEIAKKVDWVESTPGRNHIVLKNHDSVLGTATDGSTYNLAMVSKWDVADFGSAQLHANLNSKDGSVTINDDKVVATKDEVEAVDAKVNAIDLTPFAKTEDMNAAVEALNAKDAELEAAIPQAAADAVAQVVANAPEDLDTLKEVADYIAADKTKAAEIENKLAALEAKDAAQDTVINGKVDRNMNGANGKALIFNESDGGGAKFEHNDGTWSFAGVNDGGENGIAGQLYVVKKNASNKMEGTRIDMTKGAMYYTVGDASAAERMVAGNEIATKKDIPSLDGYYTKDEVNTKLESLASEEYVDNTVEGYVPVEQYNELKARLDNLEIMLSVYNAEREAQMDEIISNMSSDNKEVVIDTLMESIVVPETTVAYTITAPLTDNSTVELTSPKYMTLINTSKEPVSTTISHEYTEGETTAATSVYLVGDFDTLTIENVSPSVKSGYDAASVKNVVIPETNVKNLSLSLDFQDGATITNNSDKDITIMDKNDSANALTIVAPNSTVTLSSGQFTTLNAEVSDNTLIIKKNVHIANLNLTKGNAIVEVARAEEVAGIVENYTVADGYSVSHRIYHITNENSSKLGGVGEMILDEDITRTSSIVAPLAPAYDAVWNLNGHNLTVEGTPKSGVYLNRYTSNLEVKGEGVIRAEGAYGLWNSATTGKIIINDGVTIEAQTHAVYAENGIIEINGGTFKLTNWADADKDENGNLRFLINCLDANYRNGSANIIVRGGKFYDFDPANCAAEGVGTSFVAEGYESVASTETIDGVEHKVYTVKKIS